MPQLSMDDLGAGQVLGERSAGAERTKKGFVATASKPARELHALPFRTTHAQRTNDQENPHRSGRLLSRQSVEKFQPPPGDDFN